jgi:hypothetical protein
MIRRLVCVLIGSLALVALLFGGSAAYGNLLVNGNFGTGDFTDWTVTSTGTMADRTYPEVTTMAAYDSTYGAAFIVASSISQVVDVTAAGNYVINFYLATVFNDTAYLNVIVGGTTVAALSFPDYTPFTAYSIPFAASAGSQTVEFDFIPSQNGPEYFDDVSMTQVAVPEPSTMIAGALLLLPFGSSAVRLLRKKLQTA